MDDNTLTSLYKNDLENYREQGYKISYTTKKGDWYVISGSNKTKQFYRREWVRVHTVKGMTIEYPASLGKKLDGMVAKLSKGFEIGPDAEEW